MTRRGTILFVVVLALAIAALVTAGMIQSASAARATGRAGADRDQLRALAWSGVLAAMNELGAQRGSLLKGKDPTLTSRWQLFAADGLKGTVSLQAFGSKACVSECARLDVNGASATDLARVPGLESVADALAGGTWTSPEELRAAASGPPPATPGLAESALPESAPGLSSSVESKDPSQAGPPAWLSRVTVFGADAGVTAGGTERIELGSAWDLASAKAAAGDDAGVSGVLEALAADTKRPTTMAGLVGWLSAKNTPLSQWGGVLDVFCDSAGERTRVLDINRADAGAIAGLPGFTSDLAAKLVAARQRLDEATLASPAWPVIAGVLNAQQLGELLPRITTRSLVWRVRVVAEISPASDEPELGPAAATESALARAGAGQSEGDAPQASSAADVPLPGLRMIYDAVIDVTGATPRVAYLREGTWDGLVLPKPAPAAVPQEQGTTPAAGLPEPELPPRVGEALGDSEPAATVPLPAEDKAPARGERVGRWIGASASGGH